MCKNSCCNKKNKKETKYKNMHGSFNWRLKQMGTEVDSRDFHKSEKGKVREGRQKLEQK